jgi:hypothetical protein
VRQRVAIESYAKASGYVIVGRALRQAKGGRPVGEASRAGVSETQPGVLGTRNFLAASQIEAALKWPSSRCNVGGAWGITGCTASSWASRQALLSVLLLFRQGPGRRRETGPAIRQPPIRLFGFSGRVLCGLCAEAVNVCSSLRQLSPQ